LWEGVSILYSDEKLLKRVKNFIDKNNLIRKGNIGVAVSGGPDSVFLLYVLNALKNELNIQITVLHFNHKLREESNDEELFVKTTAEKLGNNFASDSFDINNFAKINKLSLEEAARIKRYAFFKSCAKKFNLHSVALGHTKNDLSETFIMHMLRGSGLDGLTSMKLKRDIYIRPIIFLEKSEIVEFLNNENIKYKIDSSNGSLTFTRNKIRLTLMNILKEYNSNITDTIFREVNILNSDNEFINDSALENFLECATIENNCISIDINKISPYKSIRRRIIAISVKRLNNSFYSISFNNIERIVGLIENRKSEIILRGILKAFVFDNKLVIKKL